MKKRLDLILIEKKLATTRTKAQALIMSGQVLVNDQPQAKPGTLVDDTNVEIRIRGAEHPYVSRGAIKLLMAMDEFHITSQNRTCLDVGASTGGFTEVLLLRGAKKVYAVDVGHNQMDWKIRKDPRVVVLEKINAKFLTEEHIKETVEIIVVDVSFISLKKIFGSLVQFSKKETDWITLIKPQFEVGRENVGKGGIVTSEEARQRAIESVVEFAKTLGLIERGLIESPIKGSQGNKEYLVHWQRS